MGRAKQLKEVRRVQRTEQATRHERRNRYLRWGIGLTTFALVAAFVLPAAYRATGSDFLARTGIVKPLTEKSTMNATERLTIQTDKGTIKLELYPEKAPKTVEHITGLAKKGFYDGVTFHRVVPGFVVQGGDPTGTGSGGSGTNIPFEENDLKHEKGVLAMARSQSKDSADSQFYITLDAQPSLDGEYVVFGRVTEGMDVVERIAQGDKMTKVTVGP